MPTSIQHAVTPSPHHQFAVQGRQGQLTLHVQGTLAAPWTVLFGPSGSGKSTILRALAGLMPHLSTTFTRFDSKAGALALEDTSPERRHLAYAPQHALLLPHLTAAQNIRFPESLHRQPPTESLVPEITSLLALAPLLHKRPHQLSGGERQRVSLARSLAVPNARLLVLDEPFAGLDRALRDDLLPRLRAHLTLRALPVLSVTHDVDEALLLDAEVLRLHDGVLTAQGPAHEVLADEVIRLHRILQPR